MRAFIWSVIFVWACGNQATPESTTPTASATATAAPTQSAAPIASEAPSATATPSATASATPPAPSKTVAEVLAKATTIKLTWRPKLDSNDAKLLDITAAASIKAIVDAIGGAQSPQGPGPSYMATFTLKFLDHDGNPLATISLYASATMSDSNKKYGRINVADGTYGGITVASYADLQKKLKSLGVDLP